MDEESAQRRASACALTSLTSRPNAVQKGYPNMLVLSRKLKEKIVLPTFSTITQVLEIKPGTVRLGIEAPPEVTILREEVPNRAKEWGKVSTRSSAEAKPDSFKSQVCDRLKATGQWLGLTRLQLDAGLIEEVRASLA